MTEKIMRKYAELIVKKGVNVQPNQDVLITASVEDSYFVKYVVEEAYKASARIVSVEWAFQDKTKLDYQYASTEALCEIPEWFEKRLQYRVDTLPAQIHIVSTDPDGMNGVDQNKVMEVRKTTGPTIRKYRNMMDNKFQWNIAGIPSLKWAKKVFPDLDDEAAIEALWEAIVKVSRVDENAIQNWENHNKSMHDKCTILNELNIETLHFKNAKGTDFSISLIPGVGWIGGSNCTISGVEYNPNIPTEECFTSPDKDTASGVVMSAKPLSVLGKLVDDFGFRFENGKVVEVIAKNDDDKELLTKLVNLDLGASMLGEVALVPFSSPVSQSNILFFNTLYDENAACHLALGVGFPDTIIGYEKMTEEEIAKFNINQSMSHTDFMIGTSDLEINATTRDGKKVQIFKNGNWAI